VRDGHRREAVRHSTPGIGAESAAISSLPCSQTYPSKEDLARCGPAAPRRLILFGGCDVALQGRRNVRLDRGPALPDGWACRFGHTRFKRVALLGNCASGRAEAA